MDIFLVLMFVSFLGLVAGLIAPTLIKLKSRKIALLVFGIPIILFFVLFGLTSSAPARQPVSASLSEQDKIKQSITAVLVGETNNGKEKIKSIEVNPDPPSQKTASPTYSVNVEFNANDNLTNNFTRGGIESKMSDIYQAIYANYKDVSSTQVAAYLDVTDQYGNTKNSVVYTTLLDHHVGEKINWSADKASLELQIVPALWTSVLEMPFLRQ
jgi:hypothetical protein